MNENSWILINISLKFVPRVPINNIPALVQIMAWRRPGNKPLSEPMMLSLLTHKCVTWSQWIHLTLRNKLQWKFYRNSYIFIHEILLFHVCPSPIILSGDTSAEMPQTKYHQFYILGGLPNRNHQQCSLSLVVRSGTMNFLPGQGTIKENHNIIVNSTWNYIMKTYNMWI